MFQETDSDKDGTIKIEELEKLPPEFVTAYTVGSEGERSWKPGIDLNGDGAASIGDELEPIWIRLFKYYTTAEFPTSKWYQSHFAIEPTLDVIGNVPANVLILHGEEDKQGPLSEILLLERKLKEAEHPDHTLITYPGLGHSFHPVIRQWRRAGVLRAIRYSRKRWLYEVPRCCQDRVQRLHLARLRLERGGHRNFFCLPALAEETQRN